MSSPFIDASEVRQRILTDHVFLRTLIKEVATSADEALRDEKSRPGVRVALAALRTEFERHLEYEETNLMPLLRDADAWGPIRASHMVTDHAGQRAVLVALLEDAGDGIRTMEALVDEIGWFVQSFEHDMVEEESTLLSAEALGEEMLVVDQIDG